MHYKCTINVSGRKKRLPPTQFFRLAALVLHARPSCRAHTAADLDALPTPSPYLRLKLVDELDGAINEASKPSRAINADCY